MGKKKKFIDKKKAVSFRLVHRSQRDPLQADEESSKHVLLPVDSGDLEPPSTGASGSRRETIEDRKRQQQEYGVFFDDEYDYLQHLKARTDTCLEPLPSNVTVIEAKKPDQKKFGNISLPCDVFASHYEEDEGLLNLAAPVSGPRPDWDPDIVAALDDGIDLDDPDNILEDDFVLKANVEVYDESENEDGSDGERDMSEEDYYPSDEDNYGDEDDSYCDDEEETKSKFSNFSMTSSVIRRTEGLCLLDDRFEKIMEEYDDDEIGALDHEEVGGEKSLNDPILDSIKNEISEDHQRKSEGLGVKRNTVSFHLDEETKASGEDEFVRVTEDPKEQWDCESILSTYSNLFNHPTIIKDSSEKCGSKAIRLSKREGIPLGVLSDGQKTNVNESEGGSQRSRVIHVRSRGETKEEKKLRKQTVKQERQTRRVEKKTNKLLFKEERKRQEKSVSNSALLVGQKIQ